MGILFLFSIAAHAASVVYELNPDLSVLKPGSAVVYIYDTVEGKVYWTYGDDAVLKNGQPAPNRASDRKATHEAIAKKAGLNLKDQRRWRGGTVFIGEGGTLEVRSPRESMGSGGLNGSINDPKSPGGPVVMEKKFWEPATQALERETKRTVVPSTSTDHKSTTKLDNLEEYFRKYDYAGKGSAADYRAFLDKLGRKVDVAPKSAPWWKGVQLEPRTSGWRVNVPANHYAKLAKIKSPMLTKDVSTTRPGGGLASMGVGFGISYVTKKTLKKMKASDEVADVSAILSGAGASAGFEMIVLGTGAVVAVPTAIASAGAGLLIYAFDREFKKQPNGWIYPGGFKLPSDPWPGTVSAIACHGRGGCHEAHYTRLYMNYLLEKAVARGVFRTLSEAGPANAFVSQDGHVTTFADYAADIASSPDSHAKELRKGVTAEKLKACQQCHRDWFHRFVKVTTVTRLEDLGLQPLPKTFAEVLRPHAAGAGTATKRKTH